MVVRRTRGQENPQLQLSNSASTGSSVLARSAQAQRRAPELGRRSSCGHLAPTLLVTGAILVGGVGIVGASIARLDRTKIEFAFKTQPDVVVADSSLLPRGQLSWLAIVLATVGLSSGTMVWRTRQLRRAIEEGRYDLAAAREEAERAWRQADHAKCAKSRFLSNMSHELRTPLNGVLGMAQIMKMHDLPPAQRERLDTLYHSGTVLLGHLSSILDATLLERDLVQIGNESFDLKQLVEETCAGFEAAAASKDIKLQYTIAEFGCHFRGDPLRLRQVLSNLIGNAIKFTDAGVVTVWVGPAEGMVCFAVADTGPGISKNDQALIFERFSQVDETSSRSFEGLGLGLALCRETAELMGGSIVVESEPGNGAAFAFTVPLHREFLTPGFAGRSESELKW